MKGWEILKLADESDGVGKMWHCKNFIGSNSADWFIAVTEDGYVDWFDKQTNDPINGDFVVRYLQEKEWEEYIPFKIGDTVYVRNGVDDDWRKKIFIAYDASAAFQYKVTSINFLCGCSWHDECISEEEYNRLKEDK